MAVLTLAYSAAAGAMTLALATTYLAYRQRRHFQERTDGLQAELKFARNNSGRAGYGYLGL